MKKNTFSLVVCALLWQSCTNSDNIEPVIEPNNLGSLTITLEEPDIEISHGRTKGDYPDAHVSIIALNGGDNIEYSSIDEVPDTVVLEEGNYYVHVYSDSSTLPAFDEPFYEAYSDTFPIVDDSLTYVTLNIALKAVKVEVNYSENVQANFYNYQVEIFDEDSSFLHFGKTETRKGYFMPGDLTIHTILYYVDHGNDSTYMEKIVTVDGLENDYLIITVDADISLGAAVFNFSVDTLNVKEIEISFEDDGINMDSVHLEDGLVAHYLLDGNAIDTSGNHYNGTATTFVPVNNRNGMSGYALNFSDVNTSIDIGDQAEFEFSGNQPFSISVWVRPTGTTQGNVISKYNAGINRREFRIMTLGDSICFNISNGGSGSGFNSLWVPISLGEWTHVVGTRTGDLLSLYLNGELAGSMVETVDIISGSTAKVYIGALNNSTTTPDQFFQGDIDDMYVFSRVLNEDEIAYLYQN